MGVDEDAVAAEAIEQAEEGEDVEQAVEVALVAAHEEVEAGPAERGIVHFSKFATAGNPAYLIYMGPVLRRVLEHYKIFHKKRFPHHLLSEAQDVRMHLLAG